MLLYRYVHACFYVLMRGVQISYHHINYLGHLISGNGICPLPEKLQSIADLTMPKTPKGVRQMLGVTGFYCKFIPIYVDLVRCLTQLMCNFSSSVVYFSLAN